MASMRLLCSLLIMLLACTFQYMAMVSDGGCDEARSDESCCKLYNFDGSSESPGKECSEESQSLCATSKNALEVEYAVTDIGIVACADLESPSKELKDFTTEEPFHVHFARANEDKYYTLLMVDPDVPSRRDPKNRYFLHWLVINIDGENIKEATGVDGETLIGYIPPTPPKDSGDHRYQFFLFEHDDRIEISDLGSKRECFCVIGFVERNNLGKPVAVTEFLTCNDDDE